jgi:hypothetical protein
MSSFGSGARGDHSHSFRLRRRQRRVAGAGENDRQRTDEVGVVGDQELCDHAAHGSADDMRLLDAEMIEQRRRILGHIVERVRGVRLLALHHGADDILDLRRTAEFLRKTRVAIVEANDAETFVRELLPESGRPARHLRAQAHDQ